MFLFESQLFRAFVKSSLERLGHLTTFSEVLLALSTCLIHIAIDPAIVVNSQRRGRQP